MTIKGWEITGKDFSIILNNFQTINIQDAVNLSPVGTILFQ